MDGQHENSIPHGNAYGGIIKFDVCKQTNCMKSNILFALNPNKDVTNMFAVALTVTIRYFLKKKS